MKAKGPDSCQASIDKEIIIPGLPCPVIGKIHIQQEELIGNKQKISFKAEFEGGDPGGFTWDWGDGSEPESTATPQGEHLFIAVPGESKEYLVRLTTGGPGACKASTAVRVSIAAFCPIPGKIHLQTNPAPDGGVQAKLEIESSGLLQTRS